MASIKKNTELVWVQGQLHNLINEARYCEATDAERILLMFSAIVSISIDHDPYP